MKKINIISMMIAVFGFYFLVPDIVQADEKEETCNYSRISKQLACLDKNAYEFEAKLRVKCMNNTNFYNGKLKCLPTYESHGPHYRGLMNEIKRISNSDE